jgi:hypothetical protein
VIAPLLALKLAQGGRPVVQVVPSQLMDMTVTVMHSRFGGLIRKNIWTFK